MNKKFAIGGGILAVVGLGIGGVIYMAKSNLESRQQVVEENVLKIQKSLPPQFKFEKIQSESSLFETNGSYRLSYSDVNDKSYNGDLVVEYKSEHGISSWFGGDIPFHATGKIEGNIYKTLQIKTSDGVLATIDGLIKDDGSVSMKQTTNNFSLIVPKTEYIEQNTNDVKVVEENPSEKQGTDVTSIIGTPSEPVAQVPVEKKVVNGDKPTGMLVSIKSSTSTLDYNSSEGNVKFGLNYSELKAEDLEYPTDKLIGQGIDISYDFNLAQIDLGKFSFKIASLDNGTDQFKAKGIELNASALNKNNKYDIKIDSKVQNFTAFNQKNSSLELGYSLTGIDSRVMALYKKATTIYAAGKEFNEKDLAEAQEILTASVKTGFAFSVDKIKFKNETNLIDFSGKYEILPTQEGKNFTFSGQTKFGANLITEGEVAQLTNSILGASIDLPAQDGTVPQNKFKFSFIFENGALTVNDKPAKDELNQTIISGLKNLDLQWGFIKEEVPTNVTSEPDAPIVEVKPEFTTPQNSK
jgi:hypothetical protein